ncbi:hypothetical protein ES703_22310 [subsurface metagenome]
MTEYQKREVSRYGPEAEATLRAILSRVTEFAADSGTATGGSTTTVVDSKKNWTTDMWKDAVCEVYDISEDKYYLRVISGNTATTLTIATVPAAVVSDDPYAIRMTVGLADIDKWAGTSLTGRDISLDLKSLTDASLTGLLKSIGDVAALENLITRIGQTSDDMVAAGATGSVAAKLRRATQGLEDLKTLIVLAAGTNLIGAVNPRAEAGAGQAPVGVNVAATSSQVLAVNASRKVAIITNDSDTTMYLAIGQTAVANTGIRLNANGGVLVISRTGDIYSTEAVNAIHASSGNKVATAQELN